MATDYDAPRVTEADETVEESLDVLPARRRNDAAAVVDVDDDGVDPLELPDADLSGDELSVRVLAKQADEFTCSSCFLVHHRHRLARQENGQLICAGCA